MSGRFSHYTRPFLGSSRYLRIQLQSDTVYLQVFLDPQAEDGSYTTAFLPQFRHRRQDQSVSADWRCQQPCPAQEATCSQKSPDTPGSPEGNTEGPSTASSEPLRPS